MLCYVITEKAPLSKSDGLELVGDSWGDRLIKGS